MSTGSPRIRRLQSDYEKTRQRFEGWPLIRIVGVEGSPPEQYKIAYHIRGLHVLDGGAIEERQEHLIEVNLSLGYPKRMPHCKMLTPIFHPNFDPASICIGDFWAASEGLEDLLIRIGRMIAYQEYNTKSPLNGLAAKWAAENSRLLPVDSRELSPPALNQAETIGESPVVIATEGPPSRPAGGEFAPHPPAQPTPPPGQEVLMPTRQRPAPPEPETTTAGTIKLAEDLTLVHLTVRCDKCHRECQVGLDALQSAFRCPSCGATHVAATPYKCVAFEGAGLIWFVDR
jgi:ubiquitin-protein ligase